MQWYSGVGSHMAPGNGMHLQSVSRSSCLPQPQSTSALTSYVAKAHWEHPLPDYIYPPSSLRCAEPARARTTRLALQQGALSHASRCLHRAASCPACVANHSSRVCSYTEPNHVCAEGTMSKPTEESEPREGEPKAAQVEISC